MSDVTRILYAIEHGEAKEADELLPLVYDELWLLTARSIPQELPGQTLQATAKLHEAYIRLVHDEPTNWDNRGHFFSAVAEAMRRMLVEDTRRKQSQKRGGRYERVNLDKLTVTTTCNLVKISTRPGGKVNWDARSERFIGDEKANRLLSLAIWVPWRV